MCGMKYKVNEKWMNNELESKIFGCVSFVSSSYEMYSIR